MHRRTALLGPAMLAVAVSLGLPGCGEDNEKLNADDFKNTKANTEPFKPPTAEEVSARYKGKGSMYPGGKPPAAPAAPAKNPTPEKSS